VFFRNYLGMEIRGDGLRAVAARRAGGGVALLGGQTLDFSPGAVVPNVKTPNILKPEMFVECVREVLLPLAKGENRIAVALPDTVGQVFLLELDAPFTHHKEGEKILLWHLKDLLPEPMKVSLSFQVLEKRDSGSQRLLVSAIARPVLEQYEELLVRAGFAPAVIDFQALNIFNAYRSRVELGSDFILVAVVGSQLSLLAFENLKLVFYRVKAVPRDVDRVFQELNRTMIGFRRAHGSLHRCMVYLQTDWEQTEPLREAVAAAFDQEPEILPTPLQKLANAKQLTLSAAGQQGMAAALGVAERLIQRVS